MEANKTKVTVIQALRLVADQLERGEVTAVVMSYAMADEETGGVAIVGKGSLVVGCFEMIAEELGGLMDEHYNGALN